MQAWIVQRPQSNMYGPHHAQAQQAGFCAGAAAGTAGQPDSGDGGCGQPYSDTSSQFWVQPDSTTYSSTYQSADSGAPCTAECISRANAVTCHPVLSLLPPTLRSFLLMLKAGCEGICNMVAGGAAQSTQPDSSSYSCSCS